MFFAIIMRFDSLLFLMNLTSLTNGPGEDDDFAFAFEQEYPGQDQHSLEMEDGEEFLLDLE